MDGLKKLVVKLMILAAFGGFVFYVTHEVAGFVVEDKYSKQIEQDLLKLATIVENENVLSIDTISGESMYLKFVTKVLRTSEDDVLKYDVGVNRGAITNNSDLNTDSYAGALKPENPIKVYYLAEDGSRKYVQSYTDCPNRGEVMFIELTGNVYVPVMVRWRQTGDTYSVAYSRRLEKITKTTSVICSNFYKGK